MIVSYDRDWFPPAIERFVGFVEAGTILKTTEFAGVTPVLVSNRFRDAGSCKYDSGAFVEGDTKIILLFHCHSSLIEQGISVFIDWTDNKIERLDAIANEIVPGAEN